MGNVCGCGDKEKVDFKEKERIKALVAVPETAKVLHQIDLVKHEFQKVDDKNANAYFDAFYEVLSSRSRPPQDKLHTLMLLNTALDNNPKAVGLLKRHPIYPLLSKEIASRKAQGATFQVDRSRPASWQDNYANGILELFEKTSKKHPGALPEFEKFYQENPALFPRPTSILSLNSNSVENERQRLIKLQKDLEAARHGAVQETMDKLHQNGEIRPAGIKTAQYSEALLAANLSQEDVNKLHILGLATELSALQKEADFHDQFVTLIATADDKDPPGFENQLRGLTINNYPNMLPLLSNGSGLGGGKMMAPKQVFKEEDLDQEFATSPQKEREVEKDIPSHYDYDMDDAPPSRSNNKIPQPSRKDLSMRAREETKKRALEENSELKEEVSRLLQEKEKIETSIRQQSALGRSQLAKSVLNRTGFDRDGLNMTTSRNFRMENYITNASSADLLRVLNNKEEQIEKLRKNLARLQNTYSVVYDDDESNRLLRECDPYNEPRSYSSMLMTEQKRRSNSAYSSSLLQSRVGAPVPTRSTFLRESLEDPRGTGDYKRSYII